MSDVMSYADNKDRLYFPTDNEDECKYRPSGSTGKTQPPDENKMKVNQENHFNQYQQDDFVVMKYNAQ